MSGKPYQSSLIPFEDEIVALRSRRPPMPYTQIADLLQLKYNLSIQAPAVFKFVKVRSHGRKVFVYRRERSTKKIPSVPDTRANPGTSPAVPSGSTGQAPPKPKFLFTPSDRYNLKRLPPEEAAAIRRELEKHGH